MRLLTNGDEGRLMMTMATISPLRSQNGLQICPPDEEQDVAAPPYRKCDEIFSSGFFRDECEFIELSLGAADPRGPDKLGCRGQGGGRGNMACGPLAHPLRWIFAQVLFIFSRKILRKFSGHSENFYFCTKNNTTVVLLKTASVRG